MTEQERSDDEIRALCDAATPGPWETRQTDDGRFYGQPPTFDVVSLDGGREEPVLCGGPAEAGGPNLGAAEGPDAEFIAAARGIVPSLLAERDSLRGVVQAAEALRELATKATPGPWLPFFTVHGDPYVVPEGRPWPSSQIAAISTGPGDYGRADAEFIAAACNVVRAALAAAADAPPTRGRPAMSSEADVVAICRRATAHNYGQTVFSFGSSFWGDETTVELSSWPRIKEATRALEAAGYVVTDDGERTLTARPGPSPAVLPQTETENDQR